VKDLSARWAIAILVAPVILILGLALIGKPGHASAAQITPTNKAVVAIAFISTFTNTEPAASFQRITLNVIAVRLNPSKTVGNIADSDPRWVTIGVPAGVGRNVGITEVQTGNTFGGTISSSSNSSVAIGVGKSEIQIDLGAIQNIAEIFNAQAVTAQTYRHVELVLNPSIPGNMVPLCAQTFPAGEGCIAYNAQFPSPTPTPPNSQFIQTDATLDLSKGQNVVTPLVVQVDPGLGAPPTKFNQAVLVNPTISVIPNTGTVTTLFTNPALGSIQATVTTNAPGGFTSTRPQSITANLAGTDNIVESETLPNSCNGKTSCNFIMYLPAAAAVFGGTNYDLVASGKGVSFAVRGNVNVIAGLDTDLRTNPKTGLPPPLAVKTKSTILLTGKVDDLCTGVGVQAATLDLVVPNASASPVPDCSVIPRPAQCVVALSASTDEAGTFPLPGNGFAPAPFTAVPLPDALAPFELITTAAGFDRTPVKITSNNGGGFKCTPTAKNGACFVNLSHGTVTGSVSLGSGSGPLSVLVTAEDSGTNNIENLALVTIPNGANSVPYTMNVPDDANIGVSGPVTLLDFFANTQDLFNAAPQTATGHSIAVASQFTAPDACPSPTPVPGPDLGGMICVGHGSVTGTVTNPVSTDTVVLSKADGLNQVQIETVPIVPEGAFDAGTYKICAPADSYTLTHFQQATPAPTPVGAPLPVTLNPPIMIPTPMPSAGFTPTPCPGICEIKPPNPNSGCLTCTFTGANFP
jgi:hypothetical protein